MEEIEIMESDKPDFAAIEKKWQQRWEKDGIFHAKENQKKRKFYVLEMYPYPSASFLHMGHVRNYTIGDVYARFKRMQGFNVLYPMGYDSFGLPAETAAKKQGIHPKKYTDEAIGKIMEYQKALGNSYDWSRVISSHDVGYYKWNQYFFLKLFERGLAYRKKAPVNWCPKCESVLANEEAEGGKCWRCEGEVVKKDMEQWFFRITAYADRLLGDLKKVEWPEKIKKMQADWIGRSEGTEIDFEIQTDSNFVVLHGFTSSPDKGFKPWLKKELEKRGHGVSVPKLPGADNPDVYKQAEYVLKNCSFDRNTVLVGHSLGSVVALKVLEKLEKPIKRLVLAAGFSEPGFKDQKRPFEETFDWKFDFEKIRNNAGEIIILRAKNDSAVPSERADKLKEQIGGTIVDFKAEDDHICGNEEPVVLEHCLDKWPVFTTRPDTIFGVTFMVISAQHPRLMEIAAKGHEKEVRRFAEKCGKARTQEDIESLEKEGVFTGIYATNPVTKERIPVWAGNFVLADYGSGMVMAVPAHDQRDFEFAKKYKIPIKVVIQPEGGKLEAEKMGKAFVDDGILVNSGKFNGVESAKAIGEITKYLAAGKLGRKALNYKLRDWMISRQRYWGTPIPMVHCAKCGVVPVPEKELPVLLPENVDFKATGNPLATDKEFVNTACPKCKGPAKRETDTMGGFMDSSWYFLRYCSPRETEFAFSKKAVSYWMPVDQYVGGAEHAVMHLLYARFFIKALKDMGFVPFDEPFTRLFNQGILYKDGHKMSKSFGNVVMQGEISKKYGIDTARLFLMFVSSPESQMEWSDEGITGAYRFVLKLWALVNESRKLNARSGKLETRDLMMRARLHSAIKKVTETIESFKYNLTVGALMELLNGIQKYSENPHKDIMNESLEKLIAMLSPFAPHICEGAWEIVGGKGFVSLAKWPAADESLIDRKLEMMEELVEATTADVKEVLKIVGKQPKSISIYVAPLWKYTVYNEILEKAKSEAGVKDMLKSVMQMPEARAQGKHAAMFAEKLAKDARMLKGILTQEEELKALKESSQGMEKLFSCGVKIMKAEESKSPKALRAEPGKPGIEIE